MFAVEFESTIQDGLIKIPLEYKNKFGNSVKVILLSNVYNDESEIPDFSAISISTKGYKFDREYTNER